MQPDIYATTSNCRRWTRATRCLSRVVQYTCWNAQCDKVAKVVNRSSQVLSTWLTDDGPAYSSICINICRVKLTRYDYRRASAVSDDLGLSSRSKFPSSEDIRISVKQCRTGRGKSPCQKKSAQPFRQTTGLLDRRRKPRYTALANRRADKCRRSRNRD